MEVFVFPKVMAEVGALLENDAIVVVRGRFDTNDDNPKISALNITRPTLIANDNAEIRISLPLEALSDHSVEELREILAEYPGGSPVLLYVGSKVLRLPDEFNCDAGRVVGEIRRLFGADSLVAG